MSDLFRVSGDCQANERYGLYRYTSSLKKFRIESDAPDLIRIERAFVLATNPSSFRVRESVLEPYFLSNTTVAIEEYLPGYGSIGCARF
ncbi:uncharacterized protein EAE98_009013 [Botrytis deweyae]|uniref:Uncharacterized protein n=1 Tax=Botrytis deweyae TaxID=2478750 RepID=A0ABQ7ID47_9HELO|nr:uncharacterized protein EAE98_009013 [Botrytis deweyae]KAF7920320.1 hypothetical protein EAE98_009013 [Botrytis deweyae]